MAAQHRDNIKKTLKTLDKNRTNTIIISDANYIKLPISDDVKSGLNKIFDNVCSNVILLKRNRISAVETRNRAIAVIRNI